MIGKRRSLGAVIALGMAAAILAFAAACGDRDTSDDPLTVAGDEATVDMRDSKFEPGNLQVNAGARVTFVNHDGAQHDAVAGDGSWETDALGRDDSEVVTFDRPGEYAYKCSFHPQMKARITVVEAP